MAGQRSILAALLVCALPRTCWAHGKLTSPVPRDGISAGRAGLDENNPVSFEPGCSDPMNRCDAFVCREAAPNPSVGVTQVAAGGTLQLQWAFTAFHVGDCSVYISYDVEVARPQQRWVKVANLPDCKSYPSASITIPASLPAGRAILRWDWAALHIWPTVEFYVQCADIQISSSSPSTPADLDSYPLTAPPVYPDSGNDGVGYRNAFNSGMAQDMTGPSCVQGGINNCDLTAPGTPRNTDSRRAGPGAPAPSPAPAPGPTPAPSPAPTPAPSPAPGPGCVPIGDCSAWCDQAAYAEFCAGEGAPCPQPFCRAAAATAAPTAAPTAAAPSTPTAAPTPAPSGGACVPETDCSKNTLCTGDWTAFCSALALANVCSGPYCKSGPSLLASSAATASGVAAKRHEASVVDEPGHGLRASSPRKSRAAAQVALIQRSSVVAPLGDGAGRDDPASGIPGPTAEL